jgi:ATP-dependent RNA helicase DeaD
VEVVTGGMDLWRERKLLAQKPGLVVGTPGRMLDHIRNGALDCSQVEHVVLDEADQMFDMGFREELEAILEALPSERRSHLLSATFPPQVRQLANRFQRDALHLEGTRLGAANEDIEHIAHLVRPNEWYAALVNLLLLTEGARCLVFVRRRVDTVELAERLAGDGFVALPLSGDLAQGQRTHLNAFRSGSILVATDVAARAGIDVPTSTPSSLDRPRTPRCTHRSGRTGRAGRKERSLLIVTVRATRRGTRPAARVKADGNPPARQGAQAIEASAPPGARTARRRDGSTEHRSATPRLLEARSAAVVATLLRFAIPALPRGRCVNASIRRERSARARSMRALHWRNGRVEPQRQSSRFKRSSRNTAPKPDRLDDASLKPSTPRRRARDASNSAAAASASS